MASEDSFNARQKILLAIIVALCAALPFLQCIEFPFLFSWDDSVFKTSENRLLFSWDNIAYWLKGGNYGQIFLIPFFTFMADYAVAGLNPVLFHAHSIAWHVVACVGVFYCFSLFKVRPWLAALFAIAYAVHPQKAESVAWVLERRDMIFGAFTAWSFYFYVKPGPARRFVPLSLVLFALALLSKPTAIAFPAVLLAFEFSRLRLASLKDTAIRLAPFFLLSLLLAAFSVSAIAGGDHKALAQRLLIVIHNYPWYFTSFLMPWDLLPIYPNVPESFAGLLPSLALWLALGVLLLALYLKRREFLLCNFVPVWLAFAASLTPTIGLFQYSGFDFADRYNYMPSAFLCFAGAWLLSRFFDWLERQPARNPAKIKQAALTILALWCAILAAVAFFYAKTFSSCLNLFTVASMPDRPNMVAPGLLAMERFSLGIPAADDLMRKLESSGEMNSMKSRKEPFYNDVLDAYVFFKTVETMQSDASSIKKNMPILIELSKGKMNRSSFLNRYIILSKILEFQVQGGMEKEAQETLDRLLAVLNSKEGWNYTIADKLFFQGWKAFLQKDYDEAVKYFSKACELRPNSPQIRGNMLRAISMRDAAAKGAAPAPMQPASK